MADVTASRTEANLQFAYAVETLASRYYQACAARAEAEGDSDAAAVFRAMAHRKASLAQGHLDYLEPADADGEAMQRTADNLQAAIAGELHEHAEIFPAKSREARKDGLDEIALWFETLAKAGRSHAGRLRQALDHLR
jgi:rubrerythrin